MSDKIFYQASSKEEFERLESAIDLLFKAGYGLLLEGVADVSKGYFPGRDVSQGVEVTPRAPLGKLECLQGSSEGCNPVKIFKATPEFIIMDLDKVRYKINYVPKK